MRVLAAGLILACVTGAAAAADPAEELRRGMPQDVAALIDRIAACHHWAGEEPYDAERRRQIETAVARLKCDALEAEQKAIRTKYPGNDEIGRRLDAARDLYR